VLSSIRKFAANWRSTSNRPSIVINSTLVTVIEHVIYFSGLASVTFGCWLAYHPLGFVVGGLLLINTAFTITAERAFDERSRRSKLED
jgi:hypothetical protein